MKKDQKRCRKHNYKHLGTYGDYDKNQKYIGAYELQRCEHCGKRRKYYPGLNKRSYN